MILSMLSRVKHTLTVIEPMCRGGGATVGVGFVLVFFCRVCPGFFLPHRSGQTGRDLGCLNPDPFKALSANMKPFL